MNSEKYVLKGAYFIQSPIAKNINDVPQAVKKLLEKVDIFIFLMTIPLFQLWLVLFNRPFLIKFLCLQVNTGSVEKGVVCLGHDQTILEQKKIGDLVGSSIR